MDTVYKYIKHRYLILRDLQNLNFNEVTRLFMKANFENRDKLNIFTILISLEKIQ